MKALVLKSPGQLELADVPLPKPADDQLLVRTGAAVICTSDINDVRDNPFGIRLPAVMGHEAAGTVAALGPKVHGFKVGDRVATHPVHPCGECENCRAGMGHLCSRMGHFGLNMPGTFAEHYVVRADRARTVGREIPFHEAALAEPVSVCLQALAQARVSAGDRLLVIGDGPFGVMLSRLAIAMDLDRVVIAGRHDFRLAFARGAIQLNARKLGKKTIERLRAESGRRGDYDAAILAVASAQAVREGLAVLRPKGRLVLFSALRGETPIDLFAVHVRELEILGSCNDQDRFDEAVRLLSNPKLAFGELVTHQLPIKEFRQAFRLAAEGREEAMKVAITFDEEDVGR